MKLILTALLAFLAAVSLAAPSNYQRNTTHESPRRAAYGKQPRHHPKHINTANWAGAVKHAHHKVEEVIGWLTVPNITAPDDGQEYGMSAWVGIDGIGDCGSLLQTGIDWFKEKNGTANYHAWIEWYPADYKESYLDIHPGDTIEMHAIAHSKTSGTASIINRTTNQNDTLTFDQLPEGVPPLCLKTADWVVETQTIEYWSAADPTWHSHLTQLPDFGSLAFREIRYLEHGGWGTAKGADILTIQPGHDKLTRCGVLGDVGDTLQCDYIGPGSRLWG